MKLIGIGVAVIVVLLVLAAAFFAFRAMWLASRGGQAERLARLMAKNVKKANIAYKRNRPGEAEGYLDINRMLETELRELQGSPYQLGK